MTTLTKFWSVEMKSLCGISTKRCTDKQADGVGICVTVDRLLVAVTNEERIVVNGSALRGKVCEDDPVAGKSSVSQMFWGRLYLPTLYHNRLTY